MEVITLMQTGKARLIPLVLIDAPGGKFWKNFIHYVSDHLMADKLISPEDFKPLQGDRQRGARARRGAALLPQLPLLPFVGPYLVIRLHRALSEKKLDTLRKEFLSIYDPPGEMIQRDALPQEDDEPEFRKAAAPLPHLQPHPLRLPAAAHRPRE